MDAVVAVFLSPLMAGSRKFALALRQVAERSAKPIVASFLSTEGIPPELAVLDEHGVPMRGSVPSYSTPERAVISLAKVAEYARWRRRPVGELPELTDVDDAAGTAMVHARARGMRPQGRDLTDDEPPELLAAYGVPLLGTRTVSDADAAVAAARKVGPPRRPQSRPRRGCGTGRTWAGCGCDLVDDEAVRSAFGAIPSGDPVIVQEMAAPGVATVVEVVDDPSFGARASFGLGGVATDLLGDRAYRTLPLTDLDAAELVRAPRAFPLLNGYRGLRAGRPRGAGGPAAAGGASRRRPARGAAAAAGAGPRRAGQRPGTAAGRWSSPAGPAPSGRRPRGWNRARAGCVPRSATTRAGHPKV